jgi:16S rRNA (guanine1516-N2)-methyltransferase
MLSLVVTTSRKSDAAAEAEALDWSGRLGARAVRRRGRPIGALCADESVGGALVISPSQPPTYLSADGTIRYFWHPGMAVTRIKGLRQGLGDPMVRAMGLGPGDRVLDCTLGRGSDAIVASYVVGPEGRVVGLDSSPLLAELTIHGLRTYVPASAAIEPALRAVDARRGDHLAFLAACSDGEFDVVYFDPLFSEPVEASSAMQPLRPLADHRPLALEAVEHARRVAARCVAIRERPNAPLWAELGVQRFVGGKGSSVTYGVLS